MAAERSSGPTLINVVVNLDGEPTALRVLQHVATDADAPSFITIDPAWLAAENLDHRTVEKLNAWVKAVNKVPPLPHEPELASNPRLAEAFFARQGYVISNRLPDGSLILRRAEGDVALTAPSTPLVDAPSPTRSPSPETMVKVTRIAAATDGEATRLHLRHLQNLAAHRGPNGTTRPLFNAAGDTSAEEFLQLHPHASSVEKHQFRLTVVPEHGAELDLRAFTCRLMARVDQDLGRQTSWAATFSVEQFQQSVHYVRIVVRGLDAHGEALEIPHAYLAAGIRQAASDVAQEELRLRAENERRRGVERDRARGGRASESATGYPDREFIAVQSQDGLRVAVKPVLDLLVHEENEHPGSTFTSFDSLPGPAASLDTFLGDEGLITSAQRSAELGAWVRHHRSPFSLPQPLPAAQRVHTSLVTADRELDLAEAFARELRDLDYGILPATEGLTPVYVRRTPGRIDEALAVDVAYDGTPRYRPLAVVDEHHISGAQRDYQSVAGPDLDFSALLRENHQPLTLLPAGLTVSLPLEPAHARSRLVTDTRVPAVIAADLGPISPANLHDARTASLGAPRSPTSLPLPPQFELVKQPLPARELGATPEHVVEDDRTIPLDAPTALAPGLVALEADPSLAAASARLPVGPFLRAHGFDPRPTALSDGALIYSREEDAQTSPGGLPPQHLAVSRRPSGELICKIVPHIDVVELRGGWAPPGASPSRVFRDIRAAEFPIHHLVLAEGLSRAAAADYLQQWGRWSSDLPLLPPAHQYQTMPAIAELRRTRDDASTRAAELSGQIRLEPFMHAQGFDPQARLADGTVVFRRQTEVENDERDEDDGQWYMVARASEEYCAVKARQGGDLAFKWLVDHHPVRGEDHSNFQALSGEAQPFLRFLAHEGLADPPRAAAELQAWTQVPSGFYVRGIAGREASGGLTVDEELAQVLQLATQLKTKGYARAGDNLWTEVASPPDHRHQSVSWDQNPSSGQVQWQWVQAPTLGAMVRNRSVTYLAGDALDKEVSPPYATTPRLAAALSQVGYDPYGALRDGTPLFAARRMHGEPPSPPFAPVFLAAIPASGVASGIAWKATSLDEIGGAADAYEDLTSQEQSLSTLGYDPLALKSLIPETALGNAPAIASTPAVSVAGDPPHADPKQLVTPDRSPGAAAPSARPDLDLEAFLAAQAFTESPLLIEELFDRSTIYNRRQHTPGEGPASVDTLGGDYLLVNRHGTACKLIDHEDLNDLLVESRARSAAKLAPPPSALRLSFESVPGRAESLSSFIARDGLLDPKEVQAELAQWELWSSYRGRPPYDHIRALPRLRGYTQRHGVGGGLSISEELRESYLLAAELRYAGFAPYATIENGETAVWIRTNDAHSNLIGSYHDDGRPLHDHDVVVWRGDTDGHSRAKFAHLSDLNISPRGYSPRGDFAYPSELQMARPGGVLRYEDLPGPEYDRASAIAILDPGRMPREVEGELKAAGFRSAGQHLGLPIFVQGTYQEAPSEPVVWAFDKDKQPRWKPLASYLDLDVYGGFEALPGPAYDLAMFRERHGLVAERDPPGLGPPTTVAESPLHQASLSPSKGMAVAGSFLTGSPLSAAPIPTAPPATMSRDDAVDSRFLETDAITARALEGLGISLSTLNAEPFRGMVRGDDLGIIAVSRDDVESRSLVRTPFATPARSEVILGRDDGVWHSAAPPDGICSRIVITETPAIAMAFHQLNPCANVQYLALGGDRITPSQKAVLENLIATTGRLNGGRQPTIVVTAHHRFGGIQLLADLKAALPERNITGVLPKPRHGRDWIEAARHDMEPERRMDLPAYAASRLGYETISRSPDGQRVVLARSAAATPPDPAMLAWLAKAPGPEPDGAWNLPGKAPVTEQLLLSRQTGGAWRYQNEGANPLDRGTAADFARAKLGLSLADFRTDLRRFELEQDLKGTPPLVPASRNLGERGIRPQTADSPCFRGTLRTDPSGRLVYAHQDARGMCGIAKGRLTDKGLEPVLENAGARGLWMSNPNPHGRVPQKLVIVDDPATALAYHQHHPVKHVRYIATDLSPTPEQKAVLRQVVEAAARSNHGKLNIVVATSRDRAGQEFAATIMRACPHHPMERQTPDVGRGWLDSLRRQERDFIRSVSGGKTAKVPSFAHGF